MTNKIEMFDYGSITEQHKAAAQEIVDLCKNMDQLMLAELIKHKFQLVEPNRYNMEESSFVKACSDADIFVSIQGYIAEGEGAEQKQYQVVSVTGDIRKMNDFVENLKNENN